MQLVFRCDGRMGHQLPCLQRCCSAGLKPKCWCFCGDAFSPPKKCAKVTVSHMMVFLLCLWLDLFCPKIGLEDDDIDISIWHATAFLTWLNSPFSYLNHHQLAKQKSPESSPANLHLKSYLLITETAAHGYACHVPLKTAPPQPKRLAIYAKDGGSCVQKVTD